MKIKSSAILLSAFLTVNSYANPCISMFGSCICENGSIENISGEYAGLMINYMNVTGVITGTHAGIDIESSTINQIQVDCAGLNISSSTVTGNIKGTIAGLMIENSQAKEINIKGKEVYIDQSSLDKLTINNSEQSANPKVSLVQNSTINGDIVFKYNPGQVCIDSTSKLIGKVVNGEVIKENS